jgi:hypothetical protein
MAENFILLKQKALQIRDEVEDSANSAYRVGGLFKEIVDVFEKYLPPTDQLGDSILKGITQKAFTDHVRSIENDLGNETTSESEDGSIWGKLISIIQDSTSNSQSISSIEGILDKASLFKKLGVITDLADLDDYITEGFYTYTKNVNEDELINGILIVSKVSYPGSFSWSQLRYELGKTYCREYDIDERVWLEWQDIQKNFFKSELGDGTNCGLTQKFLSEILGSEANSESEDGSVWGKLKSIVDDVFSISKEVSTLETDNERHATVRFDKIITDASIVIEGITNTEGGEVVFVASKSKFAYLLNNRYYSQWPGFNDYQDSGKVHTGKVYLCANKAYVYHEGVLLATDEEALGVAIVAGANANSALKKIEKISTVVNVTIDQLDTLIDPVSETSFYTVFYRLRKIGTLNCVTNAQADVITQCLEANCDIDVSGNLLLDNNVTEPRSLVRTYNISSENIVHEIPRGSWGRWKYNQKVITLEGGIIIE